jgi:predicted secreted protein
VDKIKAVTLSRGQVFTLPLKGKGSAGYSWAYDVSGDKSAVELGITGSGSPPATTGSRPPPASSADEQLIVKAISPGIVTIHLALRRSWEKDKPPLEQQVLKVTVHD